MTPAETRGRRDECGEQTNTCVEEEQIQGALAEHATRRRNDAGSPHRGLAEDDGGEGHDTRRRRMERGIEERKESWNVKRKKASKEVKR